MDCCPSSHCCGWWWSCNPSRWLHTTCNEPSFLSHAGYCSFCDPGKPVLSQLALLWMMMVVMQPAAMTIAHNLQPTNRSSRPDMTSAVDLANYLSIYPYLGYCCFCDPGLINRDGLLSQLALLWMMMVMQTATMTTHNLQPTDRSFLRCIAFCVWPRDNESIIIINSQWLALPLHLVLIHFVVLPLPLYFILIHFAIQYNTIQYTTLHYNTIQYNAIHYTTIQYNTIPLIDWLIDCFKSS